MLSWVSPSLNLEETTPMSRTSLEDWLGEQIWRPGWSKANVQSFVTNMTLSSKNVFMSHSLLSWDACSPWAAS